MFLTENKFGKMVEEFSQRRYCNMQSVAPFVSFEDNLGQDAVRDHIPEQLFNSDRQINIGDLFIGRDRYLWIYKQITVPEHKDGYTVTGLFDFGKTGPGNTFGFESLLYVNGKPFQGVDTNHKEVNLEEFAGQTITLIFMLWTGLEGGGKPRELVHRISTADVGYLHHSTDKLYYYGKAVVGGLEMMDKDSTDRTKLVDLFDSALDYINFDEDKFYQTSDEALRVLSENLKKYEKHSDITINCVGHTHIDVAWLWRLKHTREKAMRSFSTVNRLMNDYDEYRFLQTQPQLYDYIKTDKPEIYQYIKNRVSEGKWEADGGMWLEADCNIPSGESLVRQLTHGINFYKEQFAHDCEFLWLPDVFGYSWALPQILNQCNIKTFMTTKISWNQYNLIPNDIFRWRGLDGSEILTYFITTPCEKYDPDTFFSTYNGEIEPYSVLGNWKMFKNKDLMNETLVCYGYGDGGGGVNREMLEMRRVMDELPGFPNVKTSTAGEFFDKLHENVDNTTKYVPKWDGELYFEYHRGTYTAQAKNKKYNRMTEYKLFLTEWLSLLAKNEGGSYNKTSIDSAWQTVLRNQFHDIIPGSSIHEVYEDSTKEYDAANTLLDNLIDDAAKTVSQDDHSSIMLVNPCPVSGVHYLPVKTDANVSFADEQGNLLCSQKTADGYVVAVDMPALSVQNINMTAAQQQENGEFIYDGNTVKSRYYDITLDENGSINSIYDKENSRDVLSGNGNLFEIYEDMPDKFDAWNIEMYYMQKAPQHATLQKRYLKEQGKIRLVICSEYVYNKSVICQDMVLYSDSRRIDFVTNIDWHESHRLLKAAFDVDVRSTVANYDIQFGHAPRPTHYNTSWDYARFEALGHKWVDLSDDSYGAAILNDCKYGHSVYQNRMTITLLKASKEPDYEADMGEHSFTYSFLPHSGSLTHSNVVKESWLLNVNPSVFVGKKANCTSTSPFVTVENGNVIIDAVKQAEEDNAVIVRMHEYCGGKTDVVLNFSKKIKSYSVCNLLEQNQGEEQANENISFRLNPFELRTYKIYFE